MIDRVEILVSRLRRAWSRTRWSARLLGHRAERATSDEPGLVLIQLDGVGESVLRRALQEGRMPFLRRLIERDGHRIHSLYSGLPSSTPAVQAELFYGVRSAIPAWRYRDPELRRVLTMGEPAAAAAIEERLSAAHEGLLAGGASWSNMYAGGASEVHFCIARASPTALWHAIRRRRLLIIMLLHLWSVLRVIESLVIMSATVLWDLVRYRPGWRMLKTELRVLPMRVGISAVVREIITEGACIHAERGLPIIHLNYLGYDEDAHIRGPRSRAARSTLGSIDRCIARIARAARRSRRRDYQLWIYADHGQEDVIPFVVRHGASVPEVVEKTYQRLVEEEKARGEAAMDAPATPVPRAGEPAPDRGAPRARSPRAAARRNRRAAARQALLATELTESRYRAFGAGGGRRAVRDGIPAAPPPSTTEGGPFLVTHQGSIGMIYLPARHDRDFLERLAAALVEEGGIPIAVMADDGGAIGFSTAGRAVLPEEARRLFGDRHPHAEFVAADLVDLTRHPGAGDLIIAGWNPVQPLSLQIERGSHGGPGPAETAAFVVLPPETLRGTARDAVFRPLMIRELALELLGRRPRRSARPRPAAPPIHVPAGEERVALRLMTYNVHRCRGMDGKYTPRRIARVIEQSRPDVICIQELDHFRVSSGGIDQVHAIAEVLEANFHFHRVSELDDGGFGNAVLSCFPMRLVAAGPLPSAPPYWRDLLRLPGRGALWVAVSINGEEVQVINTHLSLFERERRLQVAALLGPDWLGHLDCRGAIALAGDFNSLPGSSTLRRLRRCLRSVVEPSLEQAALHTFSGRVPLYRIDHVLVSDAIHVRGVHVPRNSLSMVASDHLPLVVDLAVEVSAGERRAVS